MLLDKYADTEILPDFSPLSLQLFNIACPVKSCLLLFNWGQLRSFSSIAPSTYKLMYRKSIGSPVHLRCSLISATYPHMTSHRESAARSTNGARDYLTLRELI